MAMNEELKTKWLEALRSGRYEQGRGCLRDLEDKYCCLGVLCDVIDPTKWNLVHSRIDATRYSYYGMIGLPPEDFMQLDLGDQDQLVLMNDRQCKTFTEIADWIETHL